jgi:hypothetical protein
MAVSVFVGTCYCGAGCSLVDPLGHQGAHVRMPSERRPSRRHALPC